jgi:seryl-tRNA synthetase
MTLWDAQYRRVNARLLEVCDSSVRFQRLEDGRYFTVQFDDLSFLSSQRVQLFENSQAINGSTAAVSRIARLQSDRKELLQRIEYFEARAEQTTSAIETRTLDRDVERLLEDLLVVERRLKEAGVELDYTASISRKATSGIQDMGTRLIDFGSKISGKLR